MNQIIQRTWIVLLVIAVMFGCGVHRLKQAQDSYNQAVQIEAQLSFEETEPTADPLEGASQALRNYRIALSLTDEALEKHAENLKKDHLFGTALMLKALCQWRVAALDEEADQDTIRKIIKDIDNRVKEENITLGTRDKVLLRALPGLREHALGLHQKDPKKAGRLFESALSTLEESLISVNPPEDHPVRAYIRLAQMRTLRAWRWIAFPTRPEDLAERKTWNDEWNAKYVVYRNKLVSLMQANRGLRARVENMDKDFGYEPK